MAQTRSARLNTVIELMSSEHCFIYDPEEGQHTFAPDSADWFAWLAGRTSVHFTSQHGQFTARQERKQRGETYWYAYRKAYGHQHKRYLGATEKLTLPHLEQVAEALREAALGSLPEHEVLNARPKKALLQELALDSLTFEWQEDLLVIKTPSERHYLNRLQTAELLGYLYDQREAILKKKQ
jgi:hypothetical protein